MADCLVTIAKRLRNCSQRPSQIWDGFSLTALELRVTLVMRVYASLCPIRIYTTVLYLFQFLA